MTIAKKLECRGGEVSADSAWRAPAGLLVAAAVLALGGLAGFGRAALIVPLHVPLDPNEGWNAYHAAAAMTSGSPYPPPLSLITNNYPPLSFYVVGALASLLGDYVVAGRIVSLAAFAIVCTCIALVLQWMRAGWSAGVFAAALFGCTLLLSSDYVGMNDPQLLGHALQLAGLLCVLHRPRTGVTVMVSACFSAAGLLVKHNLLVLPAAIAIWLSVTALLLSTLDDRNMRLRHTVIFVGALLLLLVAALITVRASLGVNLLKTMNSARTASVEQLRENVLTWLPLAVAPLTGLVWLSFSQGRDETVWLVSIYAAMSVVCGVLTSAGAGVDVNAFFDADIALALGAGLLVSRLLARATAGSRTAAQAFAVLCALPFAVIGWSTPDWRNLHFWLQPMRDETALAEKDIAFLRAHRGPAMCEDLTFCYWSGKPPLVDIFNLDQQFETGARKPDPFLHLLRSHDFGSAELDETNPFPLPSAVKRVFFENYRVDHEDDAGTFFIPR